MAPLLRSGAWAGQAPGILDSSPLLLNKSYFTCSSIQQTSIELRLRGGTLLGSGNTVLGNTRSYGVDASKGKKAINK